MCASRKRGHICISISTLQATSIGLTLRRESLRLVSQKGRTKDVRHVRRAAYAEIQELKKIYEAEAEARRSQPRSESL